MHVTYGSDLDLAARTSLHALPRSGVFEFELHRGDGCWLSFGGRFWESLGRFCGRFRWPVAGRFGRGGERRRC